MDHDSLYETDICAWAEQQSAALRSLASRADLPNTLDLPHIVEEIEDVGNSQLRSVNSFMRLILSHVILIAMDADADSVRHWTREVATFRGELIQSWQRSMRQRIDLLQRRLPRRDQRRNDHAPWAVREHQRMREPRRAGEWALSRALLKLKWRSLSPRSEDRGC